MTTHTPAATTSAPHGGPFVVFDLDGTLLDSDAPLKAAFVDLGVPPGDVTWGHVVAQECARLGLSVDDYVRAYDTTVAEPFAGVVEMLAELDVWGVCSNKHPVSGWAELARLGWAPNSVHFADSFTGSKHLGPVLTDLGVAPQRVLFVGDTEHDQRCAEEAQTAFAWAGWNPRTIPKGNDPVLRHPSEIAAVVAQLA